MGKKRKSRSSLGDLGGKPATTGKSGMAWKKLKVPQLLSHCGADEDSTVYRVEKLDGVNLRFEKDLNGRDKIAEVYIGDKKVNLQTLSNNIEVEDDNSDSTLSDLESYIHIDQLKEHKAKSGNIKNKELYRVDPGSLSDAKLPSWVDLKLREELLARLRDLKFERPTEIQKAMIPVALSTTHDILGASETGSGKTLAFSLPILQKILDRRAESDDVRINDTSSSLIALIVEPTRELAVQVAKSLERLSISLNVKVSFSTKSIGFYAQDSLTRTQRL